MVSANYMLHYGSPVAMTISGSAANPSATAGAAGPYDVCVQDTDVAGNASGSAGVPHTFACTLLVVFDPNGGFVTGGGWLSSLAGSYKADLTLAGRANVGFLSSCKPASSTPTGETEFQFKAGNLNFHSGTYQWLVVSGSKAQYKGTGTINGSGSYKFLLTVTDGSPDKFRIRISSGDPSTAGTAGVIYDNGTASPQSLDDGTAIGGGSIVIH